MVFTGRHLFVNAKIDGELRIEVLDADGRAIDALSAARCVPLRGDSTRMAVEWSNGGSLDSVSGRAVRFRFLPTNAHVYSFWVSASPQGASRGYVGAGGPGYRSALDA